MLTSDEARSTLRCANFGPCLGAQCAMWRQGPAEYETEPYDEYLMPAGEGWELGHEFESYVIPRDPDERCLVLPSMIGTRAVPVWRREKPRRGYCGLAGEPK